jgi:hypothetical protein
MEYAYMEGQIDALAGDVRIKQDENGEWFWIKSPWDNEAEPVYKGTEE